MKKSILITLLLMAIVTTTNYIPTYAAEANDELAAAIEEIPSEEVNTVMKILKTVNVRKGPGTEYEALGELEEGTEIFVISLLENIWYEIYYNHDSAYIRSDFIDPVVEPQSTEEVDVDATVQALIDEEKAKEDAWYAEQDRIIEENRLEREAEEKLLQEQENAARKNSTIMGMIVYILIGIALVAGGVLLWMKEKENKKTNEEADKIQDVEEIQDAEESENYLEEDDYIEEIDDYDYEFDDEDEEDYEYYDEEKE